METLALVFVLLIAGATTRAAWRFGYTYLEGWEFFERNKQLLDVKLPFLLMWIAGTLDATGVLKVYILPFASIIGIVLSGLGVIAGCAGIVAAPALVAAMRREYEIAAPGVWIGPDTRGAQRVYNDALRSAHEAVLAVSIDADEAEENLRRMGHKTARIVSAEHGVIDVVPVSAHEIATDSITVTRC